MPIVTPTIKGQIVIPAFLRKKFGIVKGTPINIYDQNIWFFSGIPLNTFQAAACE